MKRKIIALTTLVFSLASATALAAPPSVEMTWMSIANWYFKIGNKRVLMDGYITRVPEAVFTPSPVFPKDLYTYTKAPYGVDSASIGKVHDAMLGSDKLDLVLVGHSHFDHSWDAPEWSKLTGAKIIGGQSTCLQAESLAVKSTQCQNVSGGEKIDLGDGITMRVVRFNHSGDASNPIQHFARELYRPPVPDAATGGYRAGVGEDFPNGGGNRAFLFTVDNPEGKLSFFVNNSASAFDLDKDIIVDGANFGSPLSNLAAAMKDAGLNQVDAWIGTGGRAVAELVVPVIRPKAYLPSHWDGLFNSFWAGAPYPYKDEALREYLSTQKIQLAPETQYFDKFILTQAGVRADTNHAVKSKLGFSDTKRFSAAMADAVSQVASTSIGDDCGEGFNAPNPWADMFTLMDSHSSGL
jgi:hypothetical protein